MEADRAVDRQSLQGIDWRRTKATRPFTCRSCLSSLNCASWPVARDTGRVSGV